MATKKKAEKLDAETAKNMVAEYMRKEYRPYAISDLVLNLHNKINKVSMAKILDELVDENTVIIKRYGKLSFYCCSERKCEANDKPITLEMLRELDNEIDILKKDSGELICAISELKHQLTDIELENKIEALTLENKMLLEQIKFQESQTSNNLQSTGMEHQIEITTIELEEKKAEKKYRKMKKIHDNILETLREGIDNFEQELVSHRW